MLERGGGETADLDDPALIVKFFEAMRELKDLDLVLAYHDRSDGGLLIALLEMAFAGHCGLDIDLGTAADPVAACFSEELGAVLQVADGPGCEVAVRARASRSLRLHAGGGRAAAGERARLNAAAASAGSDLISVAANGSVVFKSARIPLQRRWGEVSCRMQQLRDNPECAARNSRGCWMTMIRACMPP